MDIFCFLKTYISYRSIYGCVCSFQKKVDLKKGRHTSSSIIPPLRPPSPGAYIVADLYGYLMYNYQNIIYI